MKKPYFLFLSLFSFIVLLATCSLKNQISVSKTNFKEEISTQENLNFTFNTALAEASQINVWDTTRFLKFTPHVEGKFKWVSPTELVFSPEKGFQPSTDYKASLTDRLSQKLKLKTAVDKNSVIAFHTTYLKLESADPFWTMDERRTRQLKINLNFNYKIFPKSLQNLLTVKVNQQDIASFRILNTETSEKAELMIEEVTGMQLDEQTLELTIQPGVQCAESEFKTKNQVNYKIQVPNKNLLSILQVSPEMDEERAVIRVKTNQSVEINQLTTHLTINPKTLYEVQAVEDGFLIKGRFKPKNTYTLFIDKRLQGVFGATLKENFQQNITIGEMSRMISFLNKKGVYLSNKGYKNVGIRIYGVPKVNIKIYKIYENNLLYFFRNNGNSNYDNESYDYHQKDIHGDVILDKDIETKTLPMVEDFRVLHLDMDNFTNNKGIFSVKVTSTENQWVNSTRMISVSDIGFIVKESKEDMMVFVNSLQTAQAMKGVTVSLVSKSNQVLERVQSDEQGVALFRSIKIKYPEANIRLVTAQYERDFNYLYLNHSEVDKAPFEVGGTSLSASGYQAFLYGERDLYRPGETIHLNVVVRDKSWRNPGAIPVKVKLKMPSGRDLRVFGGTLNAEGSYTVSVKLPANAITGTYYAEVYSATNALMSSKAISVEEFMPDRIKVRVELTDKNFESRNDQGVKPGENANVVLTATNLFGPPAANKAYQMNFSIFSKAFSPTTFPDYNFAVTTGTESGYQKNESKFVEGTTDEEGKAKESLEVPVHLKNNGLQQGNVYATVFDENGRSVSRSLYFDIFTQETFAGIKPLDDYLSAGQPNSVPVLLVNRFGTAVSGRVKAKLVRYRWQTVLEKNTYNNEMQYVSRRQESLIKEEELNVSTNGTMFGFAAPVSGEYEVRIYLPGAESFVAQYFYAYSYGTADNASFEVNKDGKINISLDKAVYKAGEKAKILFTTPFNGRMLLTIEKDKVLEYQYLNVQNKSATYTIDIKEEHLPNLYVTATLIKPVSDGAIPLTVAHGFQPVFVDKPESKLNVQIEAAEQSESRQKQTIRVKTNRAEQDIEVTLAVVDEGILQLKNYQSPDPHGFFFQKRRLEVESYDLYPQLFPEIALNKSSTGGDGVGGESRVSPFVNKRIKLVSFWSGILKSNAAGEVSYTIDIPQFSGSLRIMAVAYKNGSFGSAEKNMKIADPVVISTGLPRFLSPNDKVIVPVNLFNTTNNPIQANLQMKLTDNLVLVSNQSNEVQLKANSESTINCEIQARPVIDSAKVSVLVNANGRNYSEDLDILIRPVVGLVKNYGSGLIKAGETREIDFMNDYVASTARTQLYLSKSPLAQFVANLDYLVQYPYGCVEQVTSGAFPQLYVQDLMKALSPTLQNVDLLDAEVRENIQESIYRLLSMQNYSGGLSYWPDGGQTSFFGTAYAAHFLLEAKKAGYEVDKNAQERILNYLQNEANETRTIDYFYIDNENVRRKKSIAPKESIYALYVLTLADKVDISSLNYYKENPKLLALDSRYLLSASYLMLGDQESYRQLLPARFEGEKSENVFSGSFHSFIRDEALALNALLESDPNHPQIPVLSENLMNHLRAARYLNTQENAFSLLALGKLARQNAANNVQAQVTSAGNSLSAFVGDDLQLRQNLNGKKINIQTTGKGNLYYSWAMSGLSATGKVTETDHRIKVRKEFYDQFGKQIKDGVFRQNDLIVVKVTVVAEPFFSRIDNVVITDMLPAGFEIENPRLQEGRSMKWIKSNDYPDYFDIRDDRINYFTAVEGKEKVFYYLVRAVTKGSFQMGPVSADAMYNPAFYSYNGAGTVKIVDRFTRGN